MRLFVGIPVSQEIKEAVKSALNELENIPGRFSLVSLDNLHFTLKYLGEVKDVNEVVERLQEVSFKPFLLRVKSLGSFGDPPRVVWLSSESKELQQLAELVRDKLKDLTPDANSYQPHLTLARIKLIKDKQKFKQFMDKFAQFDFGEIKVDKFILYDSDLSSGKPVYKVVKEFMLE